MQTGREQGGDGQRERSRPAGATEDRDKDRAAWLRDEAGGGAGQFWNES
jgi:hypothetical protein